MRRWMLAFAGAVAVLALGQAHAWEANPTDDRYQQGQSLGLIPFDTLHETITWNALDCALDAQVPVGADGLPQCSPLSFQVRPAEPGNFDTALIRGVWWNDDPNQLLNSVHYGTWLAYMKDGKRRSRTPGAINSTFKMQYRSHYGDLQFLHAMASEDGEPASETHRKIMDWMALAYAVAVQEVQGDAVLGQTDYAMASEFFANQNGWSISYLFRPKYVLRGESLPDTALGSMLHIVQDSYAGGHVGRSATPTDTCPYGTIEQFRAYQSEDEQKHAAADTKEALFKADVRMVAINAKLIRMQRARADWDTEVKPFLAQVFCLDPAAQPSGPGEFAID